LFQKTTWLTISERDALWEYLQYKPQIRKWDLCKQRWETQDGFESRRPDATVASAPNLKPAIVFQMGPHTVACPVSRRSANSRPEAQR